jgi:DNA-binding CsgD family transcriptional regulator
MLGANMTIIALSPGMETMLSDGGHIRMTRGRLDPICHHAAAKLERAFAMLTQDRTIWHGAMPLTFPNGGYSQPLTADLCPLPRRTSGPLSQARAMLVFRLPRAVVAPTDDALMTMFGLTQSEAQVGRLLVSGVQIPDIAVRRGTSVATVRSQLKAIFSKTGCSRQLELSLMLRPHC